MKIANTVPPGPICGKWKNSTTFHLPQTNGNFQWLCGWKLGNARASPAFSLPFSIITMSNKAIKTAACCIIGDEILSGKTKDTNSHYLGKGSILRHWIRICNLLFHALAKTLFDLGIELQCIEVVGDNVRDITKSVKELSCNYDIVFTSGGIGKRETGRYMTQ